MFGIKKSQNDGKKKVKIKLWTKNFTTLTVGSFVSLAGANAITIAIGLLILDMTGSSLYYAVFLALGNVAGVLVPLLVSSSLDKWPKQKVIYTLDFVNAGLLFAMAGIYKAGLMGGGAVIICCLAFKVFNKTYEVAYYSLFPQVVEKEIYSKAYSVSSLISNFADSAELIGTLGYAIFGITPVLLLCGTLFFIAACFETQITPVSSSENKKKPDKIKLTTRLRNYLNDYIETWQYIKKEKGLREILIYQFFDYIRMGAFWGIVLPFFKLHSHEVVLHFGRHILELDREYAYVIAMSFYSTGQFYGGAINYKINVKKTRRLALFGVFAALEIGSMAVAISNPFIGMCIALFITGLAGVITYCIAETVVYEKVPEKMLSRYTGCARALWAVGTIIGNILGGALIDVLRPDFVFFSTAIPALIVFSFLLLFCRDKLESVFGPPNISSVPTEKVDVRSDADMAGDDGKATVSGSNNKDEDETSPTEQR